MKSKGVWKVFGNISDGSKPDFIPADLGTKKEIDESIKELVKELREYWSVNKIKDAK